MLIDRPLLRTFGVAGVVTGLIGAAIWHWGRLEVGGFVAYAPLSGSSFQLPTHHPGWWPSLFMFTVGGLLVGLASAIALANAGWAMIRRPRDGS